ncbi:MAG: hypothetical protein KC503_17255 [Myxococcales bacterium]|nr:hypothetical protein [Myxococcales bacterium]
MKRRIITFAFLAALLAALGACSSKDNGAQLVSRDDAAKLLINRNWLDLWPKKKDQRLHVYRFTPAMGGGVYQDRTVFAGHFELFAFEVHDDEIRFNLPHKAQRVRSRFTIHRVQGPKPFDLKLTLTPSPRGPATYYGFTRESSQLLSRLGLSRLP